MADMADVLCSINEISSSKNDSMVCYKQCLAFKGFIDSTVRDLHSHWVNHCAEESKVASDVTSQLLSVLQRGLNLLQQCAEPEKRPLSTVLGSAGEFRDIVDDAREYCKMINNIIMHVLDSSPSAEHKHVLIKGLQDRLESDCLGVLNQLKLCYEKDKDALIKQACQISNSSCLSGLIRSLEPGFNSSIAEADLEDLEILGSGAYGAVYKAQWCGLQVAIKMFSDPKEFQAEYDLFLKLSAINSSHIIKILGHYQNKNQHKCLVMELMDMDLMKFLQLKSQSLLIDEFLPDKRPLPLIESLDIMIQVAKGVMDLHEIDVIHRDLKPTNILVNCETLTVKLADFGVSKADFQTNKQHTRVGTPMYMAPELEKYLFGDGMYTRKVDVYSFGIICIEILTGKETDIAIKRTLRNHQLPSLPESIPNGLRHMIQACVEPEDENRPSFGEIVKTLWVVKESVLVPIIFVKESKGPIHGLIGWWKMDGICERKAYDSSGSEAHGSIRNATWDIKEHALVFNGAGSQVCCGTKASLSGKTNFTICARVKVAEDCPDAVIVQQRGPDNFQDSGLDGYNGEYRFTVRSSYVRLEVFGEGQYEVDNCRTDECIKANKWHHLAAVRNGVECIIYVDGNEHAKQKSMPRDLKAHIPVFIGTDGRHPDDYMCLVGSVADVRIYNRALSLDEIHSLQ